MRLNIAICDDNTTYLNTIEEYLDILKDENLNYDVFEKGEDLIQMYEKHNTCYDVIFLDMEMGELDGIETANCIRKIDNQVIIVFVTNYQRYMKKSFEVSPFRFLLKPISFDDFKKIFNEVVTKIHTEKKTVVLTGHKNTTRIYCSDIILFENDSHWILIHTKDGQVYKVRKTMEQLLDVIDQDMFCKIHRAFVVNLNSVKQISDSEVLLYDYKYAIPLSRKYRKSFVEKVLKMKERKYLL